MHRSPFSTVAVAIAVAVVVVGAGGVTVWLTAGGGQPRPVPVTARSVHRGIGNATSTTTSAPSTTTTADPGSLPQTDAFPSSDSAQFQSEIAALWEGVVTDSPTMALPAFFPEAAYEQLKTLSDARSDYEDRLVRDYALDITAAHDLLGADASSAVLVGVDVPSHDGHWVPPGVCDNRIGYFEVANSRIVYQHDGVTRSFGIASLISWRGIWYVVHLGAILRSTDGGVVEDPEVGAGTSAPSSTC
jgi:hypothetical protein